MHSRYHPPWFFIPIVLAGLFPWSAFLVQAIKHSFPASWKERLEHRDALFLMLWAGLVFLFFSASSSKLVPYILPVFPPLALLIGRYLSAAWDSRDFPGIKVGYALYLAAALILAGAFVALPYLREVQDVQLPDLYRYGFALTLIAGSFVAWILARRRGFRQAFIAAVVASALFLVEVNAAAPGIVDAKSIKTLAMTLKPLLKPGDEVACYQEYYQDLPVYLERRITVVDWKGELDFGTTVEDDTGWITDGATFWKRWNGPTTIFVLMEIEKYDLLRKDPRLTLFPIARNERNILVSNREVKR